jgi:hypothetical protein
MKELTFTERVQLKARVEAGDREAIYEVFDRLAKVESYLQTALQHADQITRIKKDYLRV